MTVSTARASVMPAPSGGATLSPSGFPAQTARHAVRALFLELALYPKPGLVSFRDAGAHRDMDGRTFARSLFALSRYFMNIAAAGARGAAFAELRELGICAEASMLRATGGVNTHRGAIFVLGLLCAAAGHTLARRGAPTDCALRDTLAQTWGADLAFHAASAGSASHGTSVARRYGAGGARSEASRTFPSVFEIALPALRDALARGADARTARMAALFALLERVDDTNILYRGGGAGLEYVRSAAREYHRNGGVFADRGFERAAVLHAACVKRGLSPGGCADLLAAALFVHLLQA